MRNILVYSCGLLVLGTTAMRCALGRRGVTLDKVEGDGCTPAGSFALRRILYRRDRLERPESGLPVLAISEVDGWSDDPRDRDYNRPVTLPHPYSHERLWREDCLYDIVVTLGHNDDPPVAGKGSAIFIHLARPDFAPTEGCIALAEYDLRTVLRACAPGSRVVIGPPSR